MTIKVTVKHDEETSSENIEVVSYPTGTDPNDQQFWSAVRPGTEMSFYVYDGCDLCIREQKQ